MHTNGISSFVATFIHVATSHSISYPLFRFVSFCSLLTRFDHFDNFWGSDDGCRLPFDSNLFANSEEKSPQMKCDLYSSAKSESC